jgi:hypothetical protein
MFSRHQQLRLHNEYYYIIDYLNNGNVHNNSLAATPVKAPASSATSMTLPMWLLE